MWVAPRAPRVRACAVRAPPPAPPPGPPRCVIANSLKVTTGLSVPNPLVTLTLTLNPDPVTLALTQQPTPCT